MSNTFSPMAARAVPRLIAVVVLPTPPFWLEIANTFSCLAGTNKLRDFENAPARIAQAVMYYGGESPGLPRFCDLTVNCDALQKQAFCTPLQRRLGEPEQARQGRAGACGHHLDVKSQVFGARMVDLPRQAQPAHHPAQQPPPPPHPPPTTHSPPRRP